MEQPCAICNTPFKPRSETSRFCSRACSAISRRITENKKCEACGKEFEVGNGTRGTRARLRRFCSRTCAASLQKKKPRICKGCGIEFTRRGNNQPLYCSRACYDKHGHPEKQMLKLTCAKCGKEFERWASQRVSKNKKFYCSAECYFGARVYATGVDHPQWKGGGKWINNNGYVVIEVQRKRMLEHRKVMAESLGRPLERHETVHHLNGDKTDNRIENLQLRTGKHGAGVVHRCADCGSQNIVFVTV